MNRFYFDYTTCFWSKWKKDDEINEKNLYSFFFISYEFQAIYNKKKHERIQIGRTNRKFIDKGLKQFCQSSYTEINLCAHFNFSINARLPRIVDLVWFLPWKKLFASIEMALISDSWKIDMFALLIAALTLLYLFLKNRYSYWEHKGFRTLSGVSYIFGHFKGPLSQKVFAGDFIKRLYDSTNEPFVGIYGLLRPILLVRDPELIRSILIKDFSHFDERNVHCNEDYDPLSGKLRILYSLTRPIQF